MSIKYKRYQNVNIRNVFKYIFGGKMLILGIILLIIGIISLIALSGSSGGGYGIQTVGGNIGRITGYIFSIADIISAIIILINS